MPTDITNSMPNTYLYFVLGYVVLWMISFIAIAVVYRKTSEIEAMQNNFLKKK